MTTTQPLTDEQRVYLVAEEINRLTQETATYEQIMGAAQRAVAALDAGGPPKDCHDCGEGEHVGPWCGLGANLVDDSDPWADVPEVGTIAHYRYIGDGEAERDLLSTLLRGMARKLARHRSYRRALITEYDQMRDELRRVRAEWESCEQRLVAAVDGPGVSP